MDIATLCAVIATLRVEPSRSQFFVYESVSLSCVQPGRNSSDWTVKRNTSVQINQECPTSEERTTESGCFIDALYPFDGGVYWCESAAGESCDAINITVTGGHVILDSPVLPVMEGDDVTLSCREKTPSSNLTADFYKDGLLMRSSSTGNMTIHSVSKSDEGFYKCSISGAESPDSRLTVTGTRDPPEFPLANILLSVVVSFSLVLLVLLMLLCIWRSHKAKLDPDVSYTDVIITQEVQPNRITDVTAAPTFYSAVKPANSSISINKCV